jgi:hypothetical protein
MSHWSPLGYFVTGVNSKYSIELRVPPVLATGQVGAPLRAWRPGDPVISIRRDVPSVPVSAAERADHRGAIETDMRAADPAWNWTGVDIPSAKLPYSRIFTGLDGRIWVLVAAPSERAPAGAVTALLGGATLPSTHWRQPRLLDVFEPDGTYLGQVQFPYDAVPLVMRGDNVWMVARDANDVQSVRRYRVAW